MQSPAFAECGAVTNLDPDALAGLVHLVPLCIGPAGSEWLPTRIERREDNHRFASREDRTVHVALGTVMFPRSKQYVERFVPVPDRLIVHLYDDVLNVRRTDPLIRQREMNVGRVAAVELKDWPDRRPHLLALHVGGVTGNAKREQSNNGRDHYVVSAGTAGCLLLRHGAEHIVDATSVNQLRD